MIQYETRARGQRVKVLGIDQDAAFVRYLEGLGGGHSTAWILIDELEHPPQVVDKPVEEFPQVACRCSDRRTGFTLSPELGMYVHAGCGKPTSAALAAETGEIWRDA